MSELSFKLLKSVDDRKTKCSYCGNPIQIGENYVAVFRKISNEIRNVNYCEYCWNGWSRSLDNDNK